MPLITMGVVVISCFAGCLAVVKYMSSSYMATVIGYPPVLADLCMNKKRREKLEATLSTQFTPSSDSLHVC